MATNAFLSISSVFFFQTFTRALNECVRDLAGCTMSSILLFSPVFYLVEILKEEEEEDEEPWFFSSLR